MIGAGARKLIERGLELDGRQVGLDDITRLTNDFIDHYAAHIADESRPFEGIEEALDQLGLSSRFSAICGADTFGISKPDPAILRQTVARAGGELASTVMVGDAGTDIGVARRAGVPVIGVSFGYTEVPIADLKPDRLIGHMRDLPGAVASLRNILVTR